MDFAGSSAHCGQCMLELDILLAVEGLVVDAVVLADLDVNRYLRRVEDLSLRVVCRHWYR